MPSSPSTSAAGFLELERNAYTSVRYDDALKLVVVSRSAAPYPTVEALQATFHRMEVSLGRIQRHHAAILIDSRGSPARNDPAFEQAFAAVRRKLLRDFRKAAILVSTAVGVLQVSRHAKLDHLLVGVYTDAAEALAYLGVRLDPARLPAYG